MSQPRRARSSEAKEARRDAILRAASQLFEARPYDSITMADVAQRARLAKGTVFLYFPTREALFLDLLETMLDDWLGALRHAVTHDDGRAWKSAELAQAITSSLQERPALMRLLPLGRATLAPLVGPERRAEFERGLVKRVFGTGALVEERLRLARRGDGVQLLLYAFAMIGGLDQDGDLRTALTVLFNGFHRKAD